MENTMQIYEMASEIKKLQRIANEHKEKISRLESIVINLSKQIPPSTELENELITSFINILKKV